MATNNTTTAPASLIDLHLDAVAAAERVAVLLRRLEAAAVVGAVPIDREEMGRLQDAHGALLGAAEVLERAAD